MEHLSNSVLTSTREAEIIKNFLPCLHPATVIFVDDEQYYVDMLNIEFSDQYHCKLFTDPTLARDFIKSFQYPNYYKELKESDKNNKITQLNLFKLHQAIYKDQRFNLLAVLCTDQDMPVLDGTELCRELSGLPIFKFLFTGQAALVDYIKASQEGVLDGFIHKTRPRHLEDVKRLLYDFHRLFFSRLNSDLTFNLLQAKGLGYYLFSDQFNDLLLQLNNANGAVERYLLDESGSHLYLTSKGETYALIVRNEEDIQAQLHANDQATEKASPAVLDDIKTGKKVLFTGTENDLAIAPKKWEQFVFPAEKLIINNQTIYYSYVANDVPGIDKARIISYESYLKKSANQE